MQRQPVSRNGTTPSILVVDDEEPVLSTLQQILEPGGYRISCARTLAEARKKLEQHAFHLVLTDLYLGDGDLGVELAETAYARKPSVPVVLLTGRPSFGAARDALRSHIAEIVVKPVEPEILLATCARAIEDAALRLRAAALEAQNQILARVLPNAIEAKDPTTSGHAERVVLYTDTLARRCGVDEQARAPLRLASLLHDVGKIGIPDAILTKPGPLTLEEREVIERHPKMGYDILEPLVGSHDVRRWVYQHHERWDGKGYPEGLGGEEVDLPGRILILAEVYDALAEERSYKPAWPDQKIAALFRDQAGRQFDPEIALMVADGVERLGKKFFSREPDSLF